MGLVLEGENGGRTHRHLSLRYAHSLAAQGTSLLPQRFRLAGYTASRWGWFWGARMVGEPTVALHFTALR